ncbi:hypothetical protein KHC28_12335 [Ancylobacter sonchi]|nr:hypothetical protein [Ancylobacter sonchi]MBS7534446.1 hypothetical protein [Ancylobacter sonchi]
MQQVGRGAEGGIVEPLARHADLGEIGELAQHRLRGGAGGAMGEDRYRGGRSGLLRRDPADGEPGETVAPFRHRVLDAELVAQQADMERRALMAGLAGSRLVRQAGKAQQQLGDRVRGLRQLCHQPARLHPPGGGAGRAGLAAEQQVEATAIGPGFRQIDMAERQATAVMGEEGVEGLALVGRQRQEDGIVAQIRHQQAPHAEIPGLCPQHRERCRRAGLDRGGEGSGEPLAAGGEDGQLRLHLFLLRGGQRGGLRARLSRAAGGFQMRQRMRGEDDLRLRRRHALHQRGEDGFRLRQVEPPVAGLERLDERGDPARDRPGGELGDAIGCVALAFQEAARQRQGEGLQQQPGFRSRSGCRVRCPCRCRQGVREVEHRGRGMGEAHHLVEPQHALVGAAARQHHRAQIDALQQRDDVAVRRVERDVDGGGGAGFHRAPDDRLADRAVRLQHDDRAQPHRQVAAHLALGGGRAGQEKAMQAGVEAGRVEHMLVGEGAERQRALVHVDDLRVGVAVEADDAGEAGAVVQPRRPGGGVDLARTRKRLACLAGAFRRQARRAGKGQHLAMRMAHPVVGGEPAAAPDLHHPVLRRVAHGDLAHGLGREAHRPLDVEVAHRQRHRAMHVAADREDHLQIAGGGHQRRAVDHMVGEIGQHLGVERLAPLIGAFGDARADQRMPALADGEVGAEELQPL